MEKRLILSDPSIMMGKPVIAGTRIAEALKADGEGVNLLAERSPHRRRIR